jgi:hypothetical protein
LEKSEKLGLAKRFVVYDEFGPFRAFDYKQEALDFMSMLDSTKVKLIIKPKPKKIYHLEEAPF